MSRAESQLKTIKRKGHTVEHFEKPEKKPVEKKRIPEAYRTLYSMPRRSGVHWYSCEDALPPCGVDVLVTLSDHVHRPPPSYTAKEREEAASKIRYVVALGHRMAAKFFYREDETRWNVMRDADGFEGVIIAWSPLPKPYQPKDKK